MGLHYVVVVVESRKIYQHSYLRKITPHRELNILKVIPSIIVWELWKRRNTSKHEGKKASFQRILHNVVRTVHMLLKVRNPGKHKADGEIY